MHSKNILLAASVLALASSAEIDRDDIPAPCQQACYPLVALARQCDRDNSDDRAELNCICSSTNPNAREQLPICDACVRMYDSDTDDDNDDDGDVAELRRDCNFPRLATFTGQTGSASLAPLSASPIGSATAATAPTSVSMTLTQTSGGSTTTRTTVVIAGQTGTTGTPTATPVDANNGAAGGAVVPGGMALAGVLAAVAAMV